MHKETIAIHHGYEKDKQRTMAVPIYQTTAYHFESTKQAADRFALRDLGNIYTRLTNPTTDIFEKRYAELEGGVAALGTASGMSAIFYSIINLAEAGDNIIASNRLYGGTITLFAHTLKRMGISLKLFDIDNPTEIEALIDDKTKAIFFESLANPSIDIPDFDKIVEIANRHNIITIVDNTVATAYLCNPIELGIDIVVHSTSKYTTGQGLAIGGVLIEGASTNKKIKDNKRYYHFNEPDASYHGLVYTSLDGFPFFTLRARIALLRDIGATQAPFDSWLFIQGLETLALRIEKHSSNALSVAKFLKAHPKVKSVSYPLLEGDKNYENAKKYLKGGASGLLSFEVDGFESAQKVIDNVEIFSLVVNIGDTKSIITHPFSTTHQQYSQEDMAKAGITDGLIRLSVGIENEADLIEALDKALALI
jgi:O-acetylhomoserine (thiol)-lyase